MRFKTFIDAVNFCKWENFKNEKTGIVCNSTLFGDKEWVNRNAWVRNTAWVNDEKTQILNCKGDFFHQYKHTDEEEFAGKISEEFTTHIEDTIDSFKIKANDENEVLEDEINDENKVLEDETDDDNEDLN